MKFVPTRIPCPRLSRAQSFRLAAAALAALLALPAAAQWAWREDNGRIVYSDRPPPASVKPGQIVRQPGAQQVAPATNPAPAIAEGKGEGKEGKGEAKPTGPKTYAEREMEFRKRQQERAEADKKQQEESARAAQKAQDCERQRGYLRGLEDGVRISRTDAQGNREFLDDAQRNAEIQRTREAVAKSCS